MCGIAGIIRFDEQRLEPANLADLGKALAHRGPDGSGIWVDGPIGLVHQRLAIIDLHTGSQPMHRPDLQRTIVFNGEIFNYVELRTELQAAGYRFQTQSDTEVILVAHAAWGDRAFARFRGMYAFALWEHQARRLVLVRDPLGKKPLCFTHVPGQFVAFASEAKALLTLQGVSRRVSPFALAQYLDLMYVPDQTPIWRDIQRLPPGNFLEIVDQSTRLAPFWRSGLEDPPSLLDSHEALERLEKTLSDAVRIRLRSDVPLGIFLSGGVDSSLIALMAAEQGAQALRVFTVGFNGTEDERPNARLIAQRIGSEHVELEIDLNGPALVSDVARAYDEPFGDTSAVPTLAMARATREFVKVVLTGDGGDEIFGGYDSYLREAVLPSGPPGLLRRAVGTAVAQGRFLARRLPTPLASVIAMAVRSRRDQINRLSDGGIQNPLLRHAQMMRVAHSAPPAVLLRPILPDQIPDPVAAAATSCRPLSSGVRSAMLFDQSVYLPGDILKKTDICSMAVALEARSPLMDEDVVAIAHAYSPELLVHRERGSAPERWQKKPLKELCARRMGDDFVYRRKVGFALPLHEWLDRPQFQELAQDGFASSSSPLIPWFAPGMLRGVWSDFRGGKRFLAQEVWNLIMLDAWSREYRPLI